ncbi:hypothetical protein BCU83_10750 [Vibrio breoganii]|uniref:helix-turn-helix domain-containing protein n=1 Tax=Vibrio breoganii TaxID=553239 RepID=UPI000C859ED8|nr:AraC family transcriptional regulator [Vibrio breoganii]PMG80508.1 hypothetical protein BCU83_10750 [Vibrio breoganii]
MSQLNANISHSSNLKPFLDYFKRHNIEWMVTAEKHDIPLNIATRSVWLPSLNVMAFLMSMMRQSNRNIGLEVGQLISLAQISPVLDRAIHKCHNMEEAVHTLMELMPSLNSHISIWAEQIDGDWYLCHRGAYRPSTPSYEQAEWFRTFALLSVCRHFLGEPWQPAKVLMTISPHLGKPHESSLEHSQIEFAHSFGGIQIPVSADFLPIEGISHDIDWTNHMTRLCHTYCVLPWFNIRWLAKLLGMSERTLHRRFVEHGTAFRLLRDNARRDIAISLLAKEHLLPEAVAWHCGYSDLSNFNRAFKVWQGCTPSQYRKKAMQQST